MNKKVDSGIKNIFDGDTISAWSDDGWTYISFPFCVINVPNEDVPSIKEDLIQLCKHLSGGN